MKIFVPFWSWKKIKSQAEKLFYSIISQWDCELQPIKKQILPKIAVKNQTCSFICCQYQDLMIK